ncbi:MAG TPA: MFS transporter [Mycobacteriales bacterium]|nr:MFS transporter [Mycobacteriales bacterium]
MTSALDSTQPAAAGSRREVGATLAASFVSLVGDQLARLAMAVLVLQRTHSAALSALAYALTMLPAVVGGPLLGGLADRLPRRRIMVAADMARALLIAVPALPACPLGVGLAVVGVVAFLESGFDAARAALVADLAGPRYLTLLSWDRIANQSAQLVGFAAGGAVLVVVGARVALVLDAGTFLISALLMLLLVAARPLQHDRQRITQPVRTAVRDAADGARHVVEAADRRLPLLLACTVAAAAVLPEGLAAPYARELHRGGGTTALLMLANPVGSVASALWLARRPASAAPRRLLRWVALAMIPLVALALAPPLPVVIGLLVLSGVGMSVSLMTRALFGAAVSPAMRGRAFAFAGAALTVAQGATVAIGGVAAGMSGAVHLTLATAAGAALAVSVAVLRAPSLRVGDDPCPHRRRHRFQLRVRVQLGEN